MQTAFSADHAPETREQAIEAIEQLGKLLSDPDQLPLYADRHPEIGPIFRQACRDALMARIDAAMPANGRSDDDQGMREVIEASARANNATVKANDALAAALIEVVATAMSGMAVLEFSDLIDPDSVQPLDESGLGLGKCAHLLSPIVSYLCGQLGGMDKVIEAQREQLMKLPEELRSGMVGFGLSLGGLIVHTFTKTITDRLAAAQISATTMIKASVYAVTMPAITKAMSATELTRALVGFSEDVIATSIAEFEKRSKACDEALGDQAVTDRFVFETPKTIQ